MRFKQAIYESIRALLARFLFPIHVRLLALSPSH